MRILLAGSVTALLAAAGCGGSSGAAAVFDVAADQAIAATDSRFTVLVTRIGCNSGVTGEVEDPKIALEEDRVVLTFTVTPGEPSAADCQGNPPVEYDVVLPEPLGSRRLVDGQCEAGGEAEGTSFCDPSGVRHEP